MNIFFGKISQKIDTAQLSEGYYSSNKGSSWFGELELGDYVYLIGGDKVQFWQAREWGIRNGRESLLFDVLSSDLGINVSQLIALKFLKITKTLAVLTSRSARNKAFFKLEMIADIPISNLSNSEYYKNAALYRNIRIIKRADLIEKSEDIQLIYQNNKLQLADNDFIENAIKKEFVDNLDKKGKGAVMKDNVLAFFSNAIKNLPSTITYKDIGLRSFYDTFFCDYKEKSILENEEVNYWIFQGSPKIYDTVAAINADAVKTWTVSAHKDKIKKGDKFILWLTGANAGCYAMGRVDSEVILMKEDDAEMSYYLSPTPQTDNTRVKVIFEHNLTNKPVLWENIKDNPVFTAFKGSNQGTNFTSTEEEYNTLLNMANSTLKAPLNQILYGPPGTGKTYNTINKALEIINDEEVKKLDFDDRISVKTLFDKRMEEGQIVFTTFHQSMSYEDFIEGIKPETLLGNVTYDVIPGIFLDICDLAQNNWENVKEGNKSKLSFEEAFSQLKEDWEEDIETKFPLKTKGKDFTIIGFTKKSIQFRKASGGTGHTLSIGTLKDYYYKKKEVRTTGVGIYYPSILDRLNKYQPEVITEKKLKNYILIIDEINRGNVSQIFGELITLIEEDKRLGKDEALEVILPYSKEKFGVPPNLYIIGTMNTADRSVEALDTALRRRFSFEEIPPRSNVVEEKAFGDYPRAAIMEKINNRIELLLDRNHTLGHAYFIKENFKNSFENEIIPLLQEYFYNDYGKIGLVLGKGFVRDNNITKLNGQSIFADFETKNEIDIVKSYELIPFAEVEFETALQTLLA